MSGLDAGEFTIDCFPVGHRDTDSLGFFLCKRLEALAVPDCPVREGIGKRKAGNAPQALGHLEEAIALQGRRRFCEDRGKQDHQSYG